MFDVSPDILKTAALYCLFRIGIARLVLRSNIVNVTRIYGPCLEAGMVNMIACLIAKVYHFFWVEISKLSESNCLTKRFNDNFLIKIIQS